VPPAGIGPATHGLRLRHEGLGHALDRILLAAASRAMPRSRWASFVVRLGRVRKPWFGSRRPAILVDEPARHVPSLDAPALSTQRLLVAARRPQIQPPPRSFVGPISHPPRTGRGMRGLPPNPWSHEERGSVREASDREAASKGDLAPLTPLPLPLPPQLSEADNPAPGE
jgi:hypothetical protein